MKYTQLKQDITQGARPIYLLEGEESYFRTQGELQIRNAFVTMPELNFTAFAGEDLRASAISELVGAWNEYPFLSEKRVVCVREFYPTEKEYETYLKKYFESPADTGILVIVNGKKAEKTRADLTKKPNVTVIDCRKADEEQIEKWIFLTCKRAKVNISQSACSLMAAFCVCDMSRIALETEKLIAYAGEGGSIDEKIVEEVVYKDAEYKIYEMTGALAVRRFDRFAEILQDLQTKGYDEVAVISFLCSYFKNLYEISLLTGTNEEVGKALGMKEYPVKKSREQIRTFGAERVREWYLALFDLISDIKSGRRTPEGALEQTIAKIFLKSD